MGITYTYVIAYVINYVNVKWKTAKVVCKVGCSYVFDTE